MLEAKPICYEVQPEHYTSVDTNVAFLYCLKLVLLLELGVVVSSQGIS